MMPAAAGLPLPLPEFGFWLDAIRSNNFEEVSKIINAAGDDVTRSHLLNGSFRHLTESVWSVVCDRVMFCRPFVVAAVHGCVEVCEVLLTNGADVLVAEAKGYNVVHCLCCAVFYRPTGEQTLVRVFRRLIQLLPSEDVVRLLRSRETEGGLRPLEFSIHTGTLGLAMEIWRTRGGVHRVREDIVGITRYCWYDITEYETMSGDEEEEEGLGSDCMSPLQLLLSLDEKTISSDFGRSLFTESSFSAIGSEERFEARGLSSCFG